MELFVACGIGWLIGLAGILLLFYACFKNTSSLDFSDFPIKYWLIFGLVGATGLSLLHGAPQPAVSPLILGVDSPATIHRGWPLPWYGLVGLDMMFAPFTFLIDTAIWLGLTCGLIRLIYTMTNSSPPRAVRPLFIQGTIMGVMLLAYLLPLILPTPVIMNWLGL